MQPWRQCDLHLLHSLAVAYLSQSAEALVMTSRSDVAQAAKAIERIIEGGGTKADRARALFDLGCDRNDVVQLLDMSYSQAHSIWKSRGRNDHGSQRSAPDARPVARTGHRRSKEGNLDWLSKLDESVDREEPTTLFLSPSQVRYVTQDGHAIVRVDTRGGPRCRNCDRPLTFSLKWLGFVHTYSQAVPTNVEDHYND